ncbi:Amino-acid acetyltransferase, mitochondrial, partial [Blyttiomyces sp. JEL0837]
SSVGDSGENSTTIAGHGGVLPTQVDFSDETGTRLASLGRSSVSASNPNGNNNHNNTSIGNVNMLKNSSTALATFPNHNTTTFAPATVLRHGLKVSFHSRREPTSSTISTSTSNTPQHDETTRPQPLETVDRDRLHILLEANSVIVAGDYDGAAIVTWEPFGDANDDKNGCYYLDKFAVAPKSQGIGVADILWKRLCLEFPDLMWRSRADNPVNKWYFDRSVGNAKVGGGYWMMFWYGKQGLGLVKEYQAVCEAIPASFKPPKK